MTKQEYFHLLITGQLADELEEPNEFQFIRMLQEQEEKQMDADEKILEIIIEERERQYNLPGLIVGCVTVLLCLVCVFLALAGLYWLVAR